MSAKEVTVHVVFGAFAALLTVVAFRAGSVWNALDAGPALRIVIVLQFVLVFALNCALWRAVVLWVRVGPSSLPTPFPLPAPDDSPALLQVKRWRRTAALLWWILVLNMVVAALLI
jgi:hypothetical protein